jgi:hypothetical protein
MCNVFIKYKTIQHFKLTDSQNNHQYSSPSPLNYCAGLISLFTSTVHVVTNRVSIRPKIQVLIKGSLQFAERPTQKQYIINSVPEPEEP